eukprot:521767-Rhodomonas_salina.1
MGTQLPFVTVGGGVAVLAVSAYASRTCVVLTDFSASCWGANEQGARTHALLPGARPLLRARARHGDGRGRILARGVAGQWGPTASAAWVGGPCAESSAICFFDMRTSVECGRRGRCQVLGFRARTWVRRHTIAWGGRA